MSSEMMDLDELAVYLHRDLREITKLVNRGHVPGHKVSGQWRFARAEINHWLENQLQDLSEGQLTALENQGTDGEHEVLVSSLLDEACIAVPLLASTKTSVLKELVKTAEQSWQVYDPDAIFDAIKQREQMATTALLPGVAFPHPRRPMTSALGESVLAYGRTASGIPFGAPRGQLTDIFFLVCCADERTHLRILARLARLFLRPDFADALRECETPADTWQMIHDTELNLGSD